METTTLHAYRSTANGFIDGRGIRNESSLFAAVGVACALREMNA